MKLQSGDIFLVFGNNWLGSIINYFQSFYAVDKKASANHAGIILASNGLTIEATEYRTHCLNMYTDHIGDVVQIWRWNYMTEAKMQMGVENIREFVGKIYPYLRLGLFATNIAGSVHVSNVTCGELTAGFLQGVGEREDYWGISPDMLHDRFSLSPDWKLLFEGKVRDMVE